MKLSSLVRLSLLAAGLGVVSLTVVSAQDTNAAPGGGWHHGESVLTPAEQAELKADREQVFTANPDLKAEGDALFQQRKSMKDASDADKQAFGAKMHAYMDKLNAAIEAIDPNAAPIIAKLKAAHHHPDNSGSNSSGSDSSSTSTSN